MYQHTFTIEIERVGEAVLLVDGCMVSTSVAIVESANNARLRHENCMWDSYRASSRPMMCEPDLLINCLHRGH